MVQSRLNTAINFRVSQLQTEQQFPPKHRQPSNKPHDTRNPKNKTCKMRRGLICFWPCHEGTWKEQLYSSTQLRHQVEDNGQHRASAALPTARNPLVFTEQELVRTPGTIWTTWRREKSLVPAGIRSRNRPSLTLCYLGPLSKMRAGHNR